MALSLAVATASAAPIDPAAQAREQRATLLLASDWTESPGAQARLGPIKAAQWAAYRQALFDLTDQPGFPTTITWPVAPA